MSSTIIDTTPRPQIQVRANKERVNEGDKVTFIINTQGIAPGSLLDYNLSGLGLTSADVSNAPLSGKIAVDRSGLARISFQTSRDLLTEGPEAISLNVIQANSSPNSTFSFQTLSSRNPDFDRSPYTYPTGPLAGQVNPNTGDVRLDGIVINGVSYNQSQLQLASTASIVTDTAVDPTRGGGNLTTGYGIGATDDPWVNEGLGTTTPTADNIRDAHANFNLTSIAPIRENVGVASYTLTFDNPTNTLLLWERGNSGDVLVEALDRSGNVVGEILVLDGANDGSAANAYTRTGITVTTFVNPTFLNQGQELASVGLRFGQAVNTFRFSAIQETPGDGAVRYNGPDLKVLALDSSEASSTIIDTTPRPQIQVRANKERVNEGDKVTFIINTQGIAPGSLLDYNLSGLGLTSADVSNAPLSGKIAVDRSGLARISFQTSRDLLTEGPEAISLNVIQANSSPNSTFSFQTLSSRNPDFDRSPYTYPTGPLAGQVNPNTGDVRLDGIVINGVSYNQSQLQLASTASIVTDTAVDPTRGGGNLTTGYGIGATDDPWVNEGLGTTTPTADNIRDAHANFNLTSIAPIRENVGVASYTLTFDNPTNTLLLWERGNSGDVLVEALDRSGNVVGEILVLDGANDGSAANAYTRTGITVTTFVNPTFLNQGQELASVGLRFGQAVNTFRFSAIQETPGDGAVRYNGPDLKVLALDSSEASSTIIDTSQSRTTDPIIGGASRALVDPSALPVTGVGGTDNFQVQPLVQNLGSLQVVPTSVEDVALGVLGVQQDPLLAPRPDLF